MAQPISVDEAFRILRENSGLSAKVTVDLREALGHVLAEDIAADRDMPPFDRAMMDGFALRAANSASTLRVVDYIPAGKWPERAIGEGEAARIMTGAPVPEGADCVAMIERTEVAGENLVSIQQDLAVGANIAKRGSDVKQGEVVLQAGALIGPAEVGVLATVGAAHVPVRGKLKLAVLGSGDEVLEPDQIPGPSQIRNSNSYQLLAQAASHGLEVRYLGIAPDDADATRCMIQSGMDADVLISTGGVSAGDLDLVGAAYRELGVEILFPSVGVKPGKPTHFGRLGETLIFGLPGNPVAALVCFHLFVMTAVRSRMGLADPLPRSLQMKFKGSAREGGDRPTYRPARIVRVGGSDTADRVEAHLWHGSGHLTACVGAHGFVLQPAGEALEDGQVVEFYPLPGVL